MERGKDMQIHLFVRPGSFSLLLSGACLLLISFGLWLPPARQLFHVVRSTDWSSLLLPPAAAAQPTSLAPQKPVSPTRPVLVLLPERSAPAELARLRLLYRVSSLLEPRIAILEVSEGELAILVQRQGLDGVYPDTIPAEVLSRLHPQEQLFVAAWSLQRAARQKQRPGEGLPWDAPGFQAPAPHSGEQP